MSLFLYNVFLRLYTLGILLVSPWNIKARLWIKGRKNLFQILESALSDEKRKIIWMHCASLGEFEQGRPLFEKISAQYPAYAKMITFFSASGYETSKTYKGADYVFYLPMENRSNAGRFLKRVNPSLVIWVKYEYWYYYLKAISGRQIPLLLISGIFRREQGFFQWYSGIYREMLSCFTHLFIQDERSKNLLATIGYDKNSSVIGDTRFDRVIEIAEAFQPLPWIDEFCGTKTVIVAGSTWQEDEEELDHYANTHPEIRFIIAPHEIDTPHLQEVRKLYQKCILYSEYSRLKTGHDVLVTKDHPLHTANVLIIDNIGMLSRLYKYGTINFVGGGFGDGGVHNILEAAVYGKPVIFGPVYDKYLEAVELLETGGAFSVAAALELEELLETLQREPALYREASTAASKYVYAGKGAADKIMHFIAERKLLA